MNRIVVIVFLTIVSLFVSGFVPVSSARASASESNGQCILTGGTTEEYCAYRWKLYGKNGHALAIPGLVYTKKMPCGNWVNPTSGIQTILCSIAQEKSMTFSAQIIGLDLVSHEILSGAVGYDVGESTTITVEGRYQAPSYTKGTYYMQGVFDNRYRVTQQEWYCVFGGGRTTKQPNTAQPKASICSPVKPSVFAYVYTEQAEATNPRWTESLQSIAH